MAEKSETVTLIGQSKSGKTHLLAALLNHPSRVRDLEEGPDRVEDPVLETLPDGDEARRMDHENLVSHFDNILRGKDSFEGRNEGTDKARRYSARLRYGLPARTERALWRRSSEPSQYSVDFSIVDGRGGDLAPDGYHQEFANDEVFRKRRSEYRDAVVQSSGLVICLTLGRDEYDLSMGARLLEEYRLACELKNSTPNAVPFRHVALCLTKYEMVLGDIGPTAGLVARNHESFLGLARDSAGVNQFRDLLRAGRHGDSVRTMVFPVSTFGFIGHTGAANWYGYPWAPGLRTRAVSEYDLDDDSLPGYRDHFPQAVSQNRSLNLWQPFNLAPPLLFALTGRITGPMYASIDDLEPA